MQRLGTSGGCWSAGWYNDTMSAINEFCEKRKIPRNIESAFTAYIRTDYAQTFELREGETINKIVANLTNEQVETAWQKFILQLRDLLILPK